MDLAAILWTLASVVIVSLVSLVGVISLLWKWKRLDKMLLILVSLSAGTLFGGAFLHLLPEAAEDGFSAQVSLLVLLGILVFFLVEKFIHWRHCHIHATTDLSKAQQLHVKQHSSHHPSHLAPLNLAGDAVHNFLDGLIIAGSYLISIPLGIATTIAVVLHEVPQEIADFGVLLYSGLSRRKALLLNFLSAAVAIIGAVAGLILGVQNGGFIRFILPFAAGGFLYIAGSNLIPEMHKECGTKDSFWHVAALVAGIGLMWALTFLE